MSKVSSTIYLSVREADGSVKQHAVPPGTYYFGRDPICNFVFLTKDVSRRHARMKLEDGAFEIEDLHSTSGTMVQGQPLTRPLRLRYPQLVEIGSGAVHLALEAPEMENRDTIRSGVPATKPLSTDSERVNIMVSIDADDQGTLPVQGLADQTAQRLRMLYDLPLQFAAEDDLKKLCRLILTRVMELIPGAVRGALLIIDPESGMLALRASVPEESPPVSKTLIRRAARGQQGFIWSDDQGGDTGMSVVNLQIRSGMYVPLVWKKETLGVLCVDNPRQRAVFQPEDLQFMLSVAHYAASAVANQRLQEDIRQNNHTLQHLLANFPPALRGRLLQNPGVGSLQPGAGRSRVTALMCGLRGFTDISAELDGVAVVDMLNEYFGALGDVISRHDGTVDKFAGDGLLVVFAGSEAGVRSHELRAVQCAVAMQQTMAGLNLQRRARGVPCCELGVGIETGEVLHGLVGAHGHLEFTVIGDAVGMAARCSDGAAGGEIALGPQVYEAVKNDVRARERIIPARNESELAAWLLQP